MDQHTLKQPEGSKHSRKRVGRGNSSGHGATSTRGAKGQRKRESNRPGFEGGQISVVRRAPRLRGFKNPTRVEFMPINLSTLSDRFTAGATVDGASLASARLINNADSPFKILGRGELAHALTVTAPRISETAKAAITAAGGSFTETAAADRTPRDRVHRRKAGN